MTEESIEKLIHTNQKLLLMMGFATSLILELQIHSTGKNRDNIRWLMEAIENVVYKDEPLPPMP